MPAIHHKIYTSYKDIPKSWNDLVHHDVFLQTSFLGALEESCPKNITPYYLAVFSAEASEEKLIGIAIMQRVEMYLDDVFRKTSDNYIKRMAKALVAKIVRGNGLVVGNLMHTGQHGLYRNSLLISQSDFIKEIFIAIDSVSKEIKKAHNKTIRIMGFKDYFENDSIHSSAALFENKSMYKVQVQPNMILTINSGWKTSEDYNLSLKKKYKRRFKTARKKLGDIQCKELSVDAIETNSEELYALYKNVSDNAKVNSFVLPKDHFLSLKRGMQNNFKVFGYYLNQKLVGFYTLILNGDTLETYFLGYNKDIQSKHQMYLNMLFDMLGFAIENSFKSVVYARTAMEIKSSIGATPNAMHIYMKHTNNFVANTILKFIVKTLNPIKEWEERHPFK